MASSLVRFYYTGSFLPVLRGCWLLFGVLADSSRSSCHWILKPWCSLNSAMDYPQLSRPQFLISAEQDSGAWSREGDIIVKIWPVNFLLGFNSWKIFLDWSPCAWVKVDLQGRFQQVLLLNTDGRGLRMDDDGWNIPFSPDSVRARGRRTYLTDWTLRHWYWRQVGVCILCRCMFSHVKKQLTLDDVEMSTRLLLWEIRNVA